MGRLVDIDSLKGCAIIRPTSHESIERIIKCGSDVLNHNDIPTAYNVDAVVEGLKNLSNAEADYYYANSNDVIDRETAIDIVRKGGVI